jgi:flagellar FliJ protein
MLISKKVNEASKVASRQEQQLFDEIAIQKFVRREPVLR